MNYLLQRGYGWAGVLAMLVWASCPRPAEGITGDEVIEKMRKSFAGYKTFSAKFEKQFYWALLDNKKQSFKGRIYTRRPAQFRVELEDGDLVVAGGQVIWSYKKKNQQVTISAYEGEFKTPWGILLDYTESYTPLAVEEVDLEGQSCYMLSLKPRASGAHIAQMKIWVDRKRWHLLKAEQVEVNDNITTYILKDHRTDKKLDEALFRFEAPEGVDVIDRREPDPRDD
jgi:chaperone LolA